MQNEMRLDLEQLVDRFVFKGNITLDVIAALQQELDRLRVAYESDPDPADDSKALEEPANDWTAG